MKWLDGEMATEVEMSELEREVMLIGSIWLPTDSYSGSHAPKMYVGVCSHTHTHTAGRLERGDVCIMIF